MIQLYSPWTIYGRPVVHHSVGLSQLVTPLEFLSGPNVFFTLCVWLDTLSGLAEEVNITLKV